MRINLAMLRNVIEPLESTAPGLAHVTLLQGTKAYGSHITPPPVPARERWPRHDHANFYWLQEDFLRERAAGKRWSFTILRPQVIFGASLGSHMNMIPAVGVYGALLAADGEPLHFPAAPGASSRPSTPTFSRAPARGPPPRRNAGRSLHINNGERPSDGGGG